jgi:hypothetical protein
MAPASTSIFPDMSLPKTRFIPAIRTSAEFEEVVLLRKKKNNNPHKYRLGKRNRWIMVDLAP